jgi:hypothetical protein
MDCSPFSNSLPKKEFFEILSLRGNLRQARMRESLGLTKKYYISD